MEHSEIILKSLSYTKSSLLNVSSIKRWIVLLLYLTIPVFAGGILMYLFLSKIALPFSAPIILGSGFGFTESSVNGIILFVSIIFSVFCIFLVPLFQGYLYRIIKNSDSIPDWNNKLGLFFSGWRVNALLLYYIIPVIVISVIFLIIYAHLFANIIASTSIMQIEFELIVAGVVTFIYLTLEFLTFIFVALFAAVGFVNLGRCSSLKDSLGFGKMKSIIDNIGWYQYILSLVILSILFLTVSFVFVAVGQLVAENVVALGCVFAVYLFVMIPFGTFFVKYLSEIYATAFNKPEEDNSEFDFF